MFTYVPTPKILHKSRKIKCFILGNKNLILKEIHDEFNHECECLNNYQS